MAEVGLWWPAADEDTLRAAAGAWERMAGALDDVAGAGQAAAPVAGVWDGVAAIGFREAWSEQERALGDDAAGCRVLASALDRYADAVADAKRRVEELAVMVGATLVAGAGLAVVTFGAAGTVAATVSASLVSAAAAIGVELSATVAGILGATVAGVGFGAVEAMMVDGLVAQPIRVIGYHDGGFSRAEVLHEGAVGAVFGGGVGAALGGAAARPIVRTATGDLIDLRAPGGQIRGALDPSNWGPTGLRFRRGVDEGQRPFAPNERPAADVLASEGASVRARAELPARDLPNPDAIVRRGPDDPGTYTEFKAPTRMTSSAVKNEIIRAGRQLEPYGGGDLLIDGRALGLTGDVAESGLRRGLGQARVHGQPLPDSIRIVLGDGTEIAYP